MIAEPYRARQCPACETWVFTDAEPFAENDRTKTQRDWLHWERYHLAEAEPRSFGFPFFRYNTEAVDAVLEPLRGGS